MKILMQVTDRLDRLDESPEGCTAHFVDKNGRDVIRLRIKGDIAFMEMSASPSTNGWADCVFAYKRAFDFIIANNLKDSRDGTKSFQYESVLCWQSCSVKELQRNKK